MEKEKSNLEERLIHFAVLIIQIAEGLPRTFAGNHLAGQMFRSGTSPALNYGEATSAESRKDFVHKIKIVLKELKETRVSLKIVKLANMFTDSEKLDFALNENNEIVAIFIKSVNTALSKIADKRTNR
jgi:four helix bundle protein